jgi:hypothetical protein
MGNETAFDGRQEPKRENKRQSGPDHRVQPDRRIGPEFLGKKHQASDDMADDQDRQIGRRIVGALMEEFLAAIWAAIIDFEIGAEHLAFATGGAIATQAFADRLPHIARKDAVFLAALCFRRVPQNDERSYDRCVRWAKERRAN